MEALTQAETLIHGSTTASWLHQRLTEALATVATLTGDVAVLERRISSLGEKRQDKPPSEEHKETI